MFIGRRPDNTIYGIWTVKQWDGQEELADDHPDVVAFSVIPPEPTPRQKVEAALGVTIPELKTLVASGK